MHQRPGHARSLSAGTASVAASWIIFACLAGAAFLVTTLDTPALLALGFGAVNAAAGLAVAASRKARRSAVHQAFGAMRE